MDDEQLKSDAAERNLAFRRQFRAAEISDAPAFENRWDYNTRFGSNCSRIRQN